MPILLGFVWDLAEGAIRHLRVLLYRPRPDSFRPAATGYPTIVPLAGVFERWDHLLPLLRHLNRIGFGVHPVPALGRNTARVDELAAAVLLDLQRHGLHDVALVGHSKGGLTAKLALLRDRDRRIRVVVALATPFNGSRLAALARHEHLLSLGPASRQTIKLSRRTEADDRIVSIHATFDLMIATNATVALGRNIEAMRVGHSSVLSSREVAEHVALELADAFALPRALEPDREPWWRVPDGRRRDIARDYGFAVGWQLRALLRDAPRLERWRQGDADKAPVVLLPGVLERWHFLSSIGERMHRAGHAVHVVRSLGINRTGSPRQADRVAEFLAAEGLDGVVIVAHSKGGLIGKLAMLDPRCRDRIRGMVAVATPFNGSPYARFFVDPSIREFSPRHPVITRLSAQRAANARIVSVFPAFDQHIPTTSHLPGALANVRVPGTGHFRILGSRAVVDAVEHWVGVLAGDPPRPV